MWNWYSAALLSAGKCTESADATFQSGHILGQVHYTILFLLLVSWPPRTCALLKLPCTAWLAHPFLLLETRAEKAPGISQFRYSLSHGVIQFQKKKKIPSTKWNSGEFWESESLPLPLGRAIPERASRTELFPELWSPITAIAGKAMSFSIPRALRLSMRLMQGRIFSSYWLYKVRSAAC